MSTVRRSLGFAFLQRYLAWRSWGGDSQPLVCQLMAENIPAVDRKVLAKKDERVLRKNRSGRQCKGSMRIRVVPVFDPETSMRP